MSAFLIIVIALLTGVVILIISLLFVLKELAAARQKLRRLQERQGDYKIGEGQRAKGRKGKAVFVWMVAAALLLVAILTNPGEAKHKETLKTKVNAFMQQYLSSSFSSDDEAWGAAGKSLSLVLGGEIVERLVDQAVSADNYFLFSTTRITWEGESRTVGVGAFGHVFFPRKLDKALEEALREQ